MTKKKQLVEDFFNSHYFNHYSDDPDIVTYMSPPLQILEELITQQFTDLKKGFSDQSLVGIYLTEMLPKELPVYPEESVYVYEAVVDFYCYLHALNYLSVKEYKEMLLFFQQTKPVYFARMFDENYWSKSKTEMIDSYGEDLYGDLSPQEQEIFDKLDELFSTLDSRPTSTKMVKNNGNNVIQFPGSSKQKKTSKRKKEAPSNYLRFRIDLVGYKPPIWRRVLIPDNYTFEEFHQVIQALFEWEDYHLYQFEGDGFLIEREPEEDDLFGIPFGVDQVVASKDILLKDYFEEVGEKIEYVYDFGDWWEHKIVLESIETVTSIQDSYQLDAKKQLPYCLKGKKDAPEEDSHFEETFVSFDLDKINKRLEKMHEK